MGAGLWSGDDLLEERRARVEQMDTAAKERLLEREQRFLGLPRSRARPAPQAARDGRAGPAGRRAPRCDEALLRVAQDRARGLAGGTAGACAGEADRADQADQGGSGPQGGQGSQEADCRRDPAELLQAQVRGGGKRAAPKDVDALDQWMFDYAARHGPKKVDELAEPLRAQVRQEMARVKAPALAARVPALVWLRSRLGEGGKPLAITADELANLRARLATAALKQHIESLSGSEQQQLLTTLMKRLLDWHFANHRFGQSWLAVGDNELAQFLEKLDPEQRDKLLRLPNDEMQRELVVRYWRWKLSEELPWLIFPHHKGKGKANDSASQSRRRRPARHVPAPAGE